MNFKRFMVISGIIVLAAVIAFSWGCQNQVTGPENTGTPRLRGYSSGSCGSYWYTNWTNGGSANFSCNGSNGFSVSFSNANFVTGIGWSSGSSRSISWSGSCSGCSWGPGVYGWSRNPLIEYYIGKSGGSSAGSYTCNGRSYTLQVDRRYGQPSIDGTSDFDQYNCSGSRSSPVDMGCHFSAWSNMGRGGSSQDYQVVMVEGWSNNSGNASVTLGGGGGGSTTTTTSGGGGSTTTTSGGGGGGSVPIVVRARGTSGNESIDVRVGGNTITTWTLGTGMANWETSTQYSGGLTVCFTNDGDNRDVQIDYVVVNGQTRQSENQSYNTGVWQDGSCGGSNSEWLHCNGCIGYGDVSGGGGGGGGSTSTTTTSGSSWWGGWW
ncbi:MAG: glycoside hydrolase family 11 protein [candidate division WOR-3 bacterium]|jgi:endo-1,4-beta-xylanase